MFISIFLRVEFLKDFYLIIFYKGISTKARLILE